MKSSNIEVDVVSKTDIVLILLPLMIIITAASTATATTITAATNKGNNNNYNYCNNNVITIKIIITIKIRSHCAAIYIVRLIFYLVKNAPKLSVYFCLRLSVLFKDIGKLFQIIGAV